MSGPAVYSGKYFCSGPVVPYDKGESRWEDEQGQSNGTNLGHFAPEYIDLVREKDDGRVKEPLRVDNALE